MSADLEEQYNKIYRYCYMRLGHRQTAEDLTQETFLRFFADRRYQDMGRELAYLYTIARNQCIDYYRKQKPLAMPEEYRKLFRRKIVWITLVVMTAVCIFAACSRLLGNNYVEGQIYESHKEALEKDIAFAKALSGRALDDTLLREMQEGYAKVPDIPLAGASGEYENYARPYKKVWEFAYYIVGNPACTSVTEEELYQERENKLEKSFREQKLSEEEKEFLRASDNKIEKPFVYTYCEGWEVLNGLMNTLCVLQLLLIAICIPPIFAEEHSQRTDQLIQCTCFGKRPLCLAKLLVGVTCSVASMLLLGLAFMTGFLIFSMLFHVPEEYLLLSRIWDTFPVNLVSVWGAFENRLYPFLGGFLTSWQAAPGIYLLLSMGAAVLCLRRYEGFQADRSS